MARYLLSLAVLLVLGLSFGQSPSGSISPVEEKGTYLGVLFTPVPEVLYDQLPQLPRGCGVVVAHVLPDSPAVRADLRRNDVLLSYGDERIRDCEHLARLIRDDKPGRKVRLTLLRGGKEMTAEALLSLGPVLRVATSRRAPVTEAVPRGIAKPAATSAVTVAATPLGGNSIRVTIEYYPEGSGRLRAVTCSGTPEEIDEQIRKLPARVQELAKVGLQRLRALDIHKQNTESRPTRPPR